MNWIIRCGHFELWIPISGFTGDYNFIGKMVYTAASIERNLETVTAVNTMIGSMYSANPAAKPEYELRKMYS